MAFLLVASLSLSVSSRSLKYVIERMPPISVIYSQKKDIIKVIVGLIVEISSFLGLNLNNCFLS